MSYQYTNEDKLRAFDNVLKLLYFSLYNQDTEYCYTLSEELRQMFWNELEHSNEE